MRAIIFASSFGYTASTGVRLWSLTKVVAGTPTTIALGAFGSILPILPASLRLIVYASGSVIAQAIDAAGAVLTEQITDAALATGGALASGKAGIADKGADTNIRTYDNVAVSTPVGADRPVLRAGPPDPPRRHPPRVLHGRDVGTPADLPGLTVQGQPRR
jgi:hypothetical protein